jgi:PTS system ascorbate-specific IIA component
MNSSILIIAHTPLASALRDCVLHVFPEYADEVAAVDVLPNLPAAETLALSRQAMAALPSTHHLVLTDMVGATPCNVAQRLIDGRNAQLVAGVNLPMLLRALTYRHEPLESLVARVLAGGAQGVVQVSPLSETPMSARKAKVAG